MGLALLATSPAASQQLELKKAVLRNYASIASQMYGEVHSRSQQLQMRVRDFLKQPSAASMQAARKAWVHARLAYAPTEVFRFYAGPIDNPTDGVEHLLNAWPLDEAYIDYVQGDNSAGIINQPKSYPNINSTVLSLLNERAGEKNIATGWHAVEFLLWGQDFQEDGPGQRSHRDYLAEQSKHALRRAEYLQVVTDLLLTHSQQLQAAWAADDANNYRHALEHGDADKGMQKILTGMVVLSGFEMSGERLAVAYETQDQEEEHSCFSDTTCADLIGNAKGIQAVFLGQWNKQKGPGILQLAQAVEADLAKELQSKIAASLQAVQAIPAPFDRAIVGDKNSTGRQAVLMLGRPDPDSGSSGQSPGI